MELLNPHTIAVIGASRDKNKVGNSVFRNLISSGKKVIPINPNAKEILNIKSYPNVLTVREKIDTAVICVPAKIVPEVIKECGEKGVKNCIIISAGFGEIGNKELENRIKVIAKEHDMRILGPNCLGIISPVNNYNASFFLGMPKRGGIAFASQSGALGVAILDWAISKGIGLSHFISMGNTIDIDYEDIINELSKDAKTKVIALYIESLRNGREFLKTCKKTKKHIVVLKAGRSKKGAEAAASHTGALQAKTEYTQPHSNKQEQYKWTQQKNYSE